MGQQGDPTFDDHGLVIDQQDSLFAFEELVCNRHFLFRLFLGRRQIDGKGGALPLSALDGDCAVMIPDNAIGRCQAESGASASSFRGKEGLNYPLLDFFVNASAGIGYGDQYILTGTQRKRPTQP